MLVLFAAYGLTSITYQIPQDAVPYSLDIKLDGYIPVLVHRVAKIELQAGLTVKGLAPDTDGNPRASTDLSDLKLTYDGSALPFDKDTVSQYFPNTTTLTPQGKVIKNDAPNFDLPVHLPGVDIKRFPDITYLAVEFPVGGVQLGKSFTYTRDFGGSPVTYVVTPTAVTDDAVQMTLTLTQDFDEQEGDSFEDVKDVKDAVYHVTTHVQGAGKVTFDRKQGLISNVHIESDAIGDVNKLSTNEHSKRDLKTTVDVVLQKTPPPPVR